MLGTEFDEGDHIALDLSLLLLSNFSLILSCVADRGYWLASAMPGKQRWAIMQITAGLLASEIALSGATHATRCQHDCSDECNDCAGAYLYVPAE